MAKRGLMVPAEALLEACYPQNDRMGIPRAVKRQAVRRVMIEGYSYRGAAREVEQELGRRCSPVNVLNWVSETESRLNHAKAWMRQNASEMVA